MVVIVVAIPVLLIALNVVFGSTAAVGRKALGRFARDHALTITVGNGAGVLRYLARVRAARAVGMYCGFALSIGLSVGFGGGSWWSNIVLCIAAGYLAAVVLAEIPWRRHRTDGPVAASLTPRRIGDYVDPWLVRFLAFAVTAAVAAAIVGAVAPMQHAADDRRVLPLLLTVGAAALVVLAGRAIVLRPQPLAAADVMAADDAIRAASMQALWGCGTAFACSAAVGVTAPVGSGAASAAVRIPFVVVSIALVVLVWASWGWRKAPWTVRRRYPVAPAATA